MFGMTEDMSEEDAQKLDEINAGEGRNLTSAQKAVVVRFGTIDIKAKKPPADMTIPPLEKSGGGPATFDAKPVESTPRDRK